MSLDGNTSRWRRWFRLSRLVPLLTILGAGIAIVLSLLNIVQLSLPEGFVIALLGLLAIDALTERLTVLEGIDAKLTGISGTPTLKSRADIVLIEEQVVHAEEICIAVVSGFTLFSRNFATFESRVKDGCKMRIILLDPDGVSLATWNKQNRFSTAEHDIKSAMMTLRDLAKMESAKGNCEVRLSDVFLPFSFVATDLHKGSGSMVVEFYGYKTTSSERPHIYLTPSSSPKWFAYFSQQFEQAWLDSKTLSG